MRLIPKFFSKKKYKEAQPDSVRRAFAYSAGTVVTPDTAMMSAAFYRGVTYISTQIAKLPWEVKDKDNKVITDRVSKLIGLSPNKEMNSFTFRLLMTQNALIYGNGYAEIERDGLGRPIALWPLKSSDVELVRDSDGGLWYRVIGGSTIISGSDAYLRPRDVYHIRNFHTKDGLLGQGIISYAAESLGTVLGADQFANSLYSNGGIPSGVLTVPGTLSDAAFARLKETWDSQHTGRKTGGTAVLEEGTSYNPVSFAPDVLQFLETRKFGVVEIARFLGLPPTKLYDQETSSYNNIEHANLEVAVDTLDSWARNYETEADVKILSNSYDGKRTEMDLYAIFRGDMNTRSQYFTRMMQSGSITPNQIRLKEGMAPYSGGDRYYIATNNFTPQDRVDEVIDSQISQKNNTQNSDDKTDEAVVSFLKGRTRN